MASESASEILGRWLLTFSGARAMYRKESFRRDHRNIIQHDSRLRIPAKWTVHSSGWGPAVTAPSRPAARIPSKI